MEARIASRAREAAYYAAVSAVVALSLFLTLRLWTKDLRVPFDTAGDALFWTAVVKATAEDGLSGPFHRLGMPFDSELADWPIGMPLDFSLLRGLAKGLGAPGIALNAYWLLSMCATGAVAAFAFRRLSMGRGVALGLGVLYAVLPYAYQHYTAHFPLVYHFIPLIALLGMRVAGGGETERAERRLLLAACALQGLSYVYYSFFACGLLLLAGLIGGIVTRRLTGPKLALRAVAILIGFTALSLAPTVLYWSRHGYNGEVHYKTAAEAEVYGLRIRQMLTPTSDHPLGPFRRVAADVEREFPPDGENTGTRLGSVGSLGLLLVLGFALGAIAGAFAELRPSLGPAAALTVGTLLIAQPGGFGALFSAFVAPDIRAYGRMVVFVAFFSLVAVGTLLERVRARLAGRGEASRWAFLAAGGLALGAAVRDQAATFHLVTRYADDAASYARDRAFVAAVESTLPVGAMVFQLPHTDVPVDRTPPPMAFYDHARAYVHSRSLRWSWGDISGHRGNWQREIARLPPRDLAKALALAGFGGVWIDRYGYPHPETSPEVGLAEATRSTPLVREDGRIVFLSLANVRRDLEARLGREALAGARERVLTVPLVPRWGAGFYDEEGDGTRYWRWCAARGRLVVKNTLGRPRRVSLRAVVRAATAEGGVLQVRSARFQDDLALATDGVPFRQDLVLAPGEKLGIDLEFTGPSLRALEARAFQMVDFTVVDLADAEAGS
jgi:phosphoglycerol transferase